MSVHDEVSKDLEALFNRWYDRDEEYFERSRTEFELCVDPLVCYEESPTEREIIQMNVCYTEWFLFEFNMRGGSSPLELTAREGFPGKGRGDEARSYRRMDRLVQLADTQYFSRFLIKRKVPARECAHLVDLFTGEELLVHSKLICDKDHWGKGSLGMRVACVDGEWMDVGQSIFYDRAPIEECEIETPDELEGRTEMMLMPDGRNVLRRAASTSYYLNFLHDVIGLGGRYTESCRALDV